MGPGHSRTRPSGPFSSIAGGRSREYQPQFDTGTYKQAETQNIPIRPPFAGVWSVFYPEGDFPTSRSGPCYSYDPITDCLIIGYGIDASGNYLNDLWSLDLESKKWRLLIPNLHDPRQYASSIIIGRLLFIFGGVRGTQYFSDLHAVNLDTLEVTQLDSSSPEAPLPRSSPVLFTSADNSAFIVWSGFDGQARPEMHSYSLTSHSWSRLPEPDIPPRPAASFTQILNATARSFQTVQDGFQNSEENTDDEKFEDFEYVVGSVKGHPLARFNRACGSLEMMRCSGTAPPPEINHPYFCLADSFLFVIGGEKESEYSHIYALLTPYNSWLAFHILPDNETLSLADGNVNKAGLFQVPRQHSGAMAYCRRTRSIVSVMGNLLQDSSPAYQIALGEAFGILHHRMDLMDMFKNFLST